MRGLNGELGIRALLGLFSVVALILIAAPNMAQARSEELMKSYRQYEMLIKAGKYREAIIPANRVLILAEKNMVAAMKLLWAGGLI